MNPFLSKKDSLVLAVEAAMKDGAIRRQAVDMVNEQFGVYNRNAVIRENLAAYDAAIETTYQTLKEKKDSFHDGAKHKSVKDSVSPPFKGGHKVENKKDETYHSGAKHKDVKDSKKPPFKGGSKITEAKYSFKAAAKGEDIGKKGKNFSKIADKAGKEYGSKEAGKRVAGAILGKIRAKHGIHEASKLSPEDASGIVNTPAPNAPHVQPTQQQQKPVINNTSSDNNSNLNQNKQGLQESILNKYRIV